MTAAVSLLYSAWSAGAGPASGSSWSGATTGPTPGRPNRWLAAVVCSSCSIALCSTPSRTWWQPSTAASSSTPAGTPAWTPCSGGPGRPWSSLSTTSRCGHHLDKRYKIHAFMLLHPPQDCQLNLEKVRKNTKKAVTEILPPTENPFCSR